MSDASTRGWGTGWPNCQTGKIKTLVRKDGLRLPLREEIIPLVAWLIDETERRGYDVRPDWTWGYACRSIRGYNTPSNHSWGLAVDINAPVNPMGSTLITDMPKWMPELWAKYGFRWGGSYTGRKDAMHYEFMGTPADAARYIAQIKAPVAVPVAKAWTAPKFPGHMLRLGETSDAVQTLKYLLVAAGYGKSLAIGPKTVRVFGPGTATAVRRLAADYYRTKKIVPPLVLPASVGPKLWSFLCDVVRVKKAQGQ